MTENCARPGCGHLEDEHSTVCLHHEPSDACELCGSTIRYLSCPCAGFRSQAQQEAWDGLEMALEARRGELLAGRPHSAPGLVEMAEWVLELYP
jgi:hypothetical protein